MGDKLPRAGGKRFVRLRATTYEKLRAAAERAEVVLDPTQFDMVERAGKKFYRYRGAVGGATDGRGGGGGGRYVPRIGGEGSDQLFVSPGSIAYCRIGVENLGDSTPGESVRVVPVMAEIDGVALDAEEAPSFAIGGKTSGALWLKVDRTRCPGSTLVPAEDSTATNELVLLNRGDKPPRKDGELHVLLCEMDFEAGDGGAKTLANVDTKWESDWPVWFTCEEDESDSYSLSEPSDIHSSDLESSDESDPDGSSTEEGDCPWAAEAKWYRKASCYERGRPVTIGWQVGVGIKTMRAKCFKWEVRISFPGGTPVPVAGQTANGGQLIVPMTGNKILIQARFRFPMGPPQCANTALTVTVVGIPDPDLTGDADPCCKSHTKKFPDQWPRWCRHNCRTTVVA